jgi:AcrR family transcriptional regulator
MASSLDRIVTPWGKLGTLRTNRLKPGPGKSRDAVARQQRTRIFAAMVAVTSERGYAMARVADVIEAAGVSRSTFYAHFEDFDDCFVATLDAALALLDGALGDPLESGGAWEARLRSYFDALVAVVVAQPAAAQMCLVEAYAAGPEAVERVDRFARAAGRRVLAVVAESPERAEMPTNVSRAVLGGLRMIIQLRLYEGREDELPEIAPRLMDWALGYRTPPSELRPPRRGPRPSALPPAPEDDSRQQIVTAMTEVVAERGYSQTTITEIAQVASISLTTFYKRFDSKEKAFLGALDFVMLHLLQVSLPAYRDAEDWAHGVHQSLEAILTEASRYPALARFGAEAVWSGGPAAVARVGESMAGFQALLTEGLGRRSARERIVAEAIGASIVALVYDEVARGNGTRLYRLTPTAAFVALAPAIGSIEACTIANGG